jgi:excisionase family DNA binding protein
MKNTIKTTYSDIEFRQLIRDEVQTVLNNIPGLPKIEVNEGYIGITEAAAFLKLVKGTVYNMVHQNKLPYHKSGKKVLFKKSELAEWLLYGSENEAGAAN